MNKDLDAELEAAAELKTALRHLENMVCLASSYNRMKLGFDTEPVIHAREFIAKLKNTPRTSAGGEAARD